MLFVSILNLKKFTIQLKSVYRLPTAINNASPKVRDVVFVLLTKGIIGVDTLYGYL